MRASILSALLLLSTTSAGAATSLNQAAKSAGYQPLALPSTGFEPGQLLSATIGRDGTVNPVLVCTRDQYAGPLTLITSTAPETASIQNLQAGVNITAKIKSWLTANADFSHVKGVTLRLSNVKTETVPEASIIAGAQASQSSQCATGINKYEAERNSKYLHVVEGILIADIDYAVDPKTNADVGAKAVAKQISITLGANYNQTDEYTVKGPGLVIGVMLSRPNRVYAKKP